MKSKTLITTLGLVVTAVSAAGLGSSKLFSQSNSQSKEKTQEMENETVETTKGLDILTKDNEAENLGKIPELKPEDYQKPEENYKKQYGHYLGENGMVFRGVEGKDYKLEDIKAEDCVSRGDSYSLIDREKNIHKCVTYINED